MLPTHLVKNVDVWEKAIIQNINFRSLLYYLPTLHDFKFLDTDKPLALKVAEVLDGKNKIKAAALHPFYIYSYYRLFCEKRRFLDHTKEEFHNKKIKRILIDLHKPILEKLYSAFEKSFDFYPRTNLRYVITLDNRSCLRTKKIFSRHNHIISVFDASLIIALTLLKREPNCTVLTFGETELKPLKLQRDMSFEVAKKHCEDVMNKKSIRSLGMPVTYATENKIQADVFLTISDAVVNCSNLRKTPTQALNVYEEVMKLQPRYVTLGLCRHQRDLGEEDPRVFEAAGFTVETLKIIEMFASRRFD